MTRKLIGIVAGLIAAAAVVFLIESIDHALYAPVGVTSTPVAMDQVIAGLPFGAKLVVVIGWFLGAAVGSALAIRLSGWPPSAWVVAILMAIGGIVSVMQIPHPVWMQIAGVVTPLLGALAAGPIARWSAERAANRI